MDGLIAKFGDNVSAKVGVTNNFQITLKRDNNCRLSHLAVHVCMYVYVQLVVYPRVGGQQCSESLSWTIAAVCTWRIGWSLSAEKGIRAYDGVGSTSKALLYE